MPRKDKSIKHIPSYFILWVTLLLVVAASLLIGINGNGGLSQAYKLATTHKIESYTQLYFDSPSQLPLYAATGKVQTVNFTIGNYTARTKTYNYEVVFTVGTKTTTSIQTTKVLQGSSTQLSTRFTIPTPLTKANLIIKLLGSNQQLTLESTS
jgi:hypothetical protein